MMSVTPHGLLVRHGRNPTWHVPVTSRLDDMAAAGDMAVGWHSGLWLVVSSHFHDGGLWLSRQRDVGEGGGENGETS